jgi:hypothetical protein
MPTPVANDKRSLGRQIAQEVSASKATGVVAERSESPSSQSFVRVKKPIKKHPTTPPKPSPKPKPVKKKN